MLLENFLILHAPAKHITSNTVYLFLYTCDAMVDFSIASKLLFDINVLL